MILDLFKRMFCSCDQSDEIKYLNGRIESLTKSIGKSLIPVEFSCESKTIKLYTVFGINAVVADGEYEAISLDDWKVVLSGVYDNIRGQEKYTKSVFDCDDFALIFSGMVAYSAFKSGFKNQLAFGIGWSKTHAFNVFVDNNGNEYIYEPQNNKIVDRKGEYDVSKIWFMS